MNVRDRVLSGRLKSGKVGTKEDTLRSFSVTPVVLYASLNSTTGENLPRRQNKTYFLGY